MVPVCENRQLTFLTISIEWRWKGQPYAFPIACLLFSNLASSCDGEDGVLLWDLLLEESSAWEAKYSSARTISLMRGRKLACSWRHIDVIATACCRLRTEKHPSNRGSTSWTNFRRSLRKGWDCNKIESIRHIEQDCRIYRIEKHRNIYLCYESLAREQDLEGQM